MTHLHTIRWRPCAALAAAVLLFASVSARAQSWPRSMAPNVVQLTKQAGLEDPGGLPDPFWIHLHRGHHSAPDAAEATLRVRLFRGNSIYDEIGVDGSGLTDIRFLVHGVDVSGWMAFERDPFTWTLNIDDPDLNGLSDGLHDITVQVRGPAYETFKPAPIFVHLTRGRAVAADVPIMSAQAGGQVIDAGPHVQYVRAAERQFRAYPVESEVTPFHDPPYAASLFGELMTPNAEYETSAQMWWEELPHGLPFVRAMKPKLTNDDHRFMSIFDGVAEDPGFFDQERMPYKDGGRGIGWMSGLVSGQIDTRGRFAFAEIGGRVGYMMPDGEIVTIAGWRVQPGKDPVWITKSMTQIRGNMELRGVWLEGTYPGESGGFRTPLDVAIDPRDEHVLYVAAYHDHCIWKVVVDPATRVGTVTVFAGDPDHSSGSADGQGHAARMNGPTSVVFDPVRDVLYVADQQNHSIRRITREGVVTTLAGRADMVRELERRGVRDRFDRDQVKPAMRLAVTASEAASGLRADLYMPMTVRVDSRGRVITLGLGDGLIRRIDPASGVTAILGRVDSKFEAGIIGWAWLDVDRWGNSGPKDGIYWCKTVGSTADGDNDERFNEVYAWLPPDGGGSRFIFGPNWEPNPNAWGSTDHMGPQHYPWLVAVDPRGALLIAGLGEHGVTRVRARRASDRAPADLFPRYFDGQRFWWQGSPAGDAPSGTFKFGWDGHNYLGFADAWGLTGHETDTQLFDRFAAPAGLRGDPAWADAWLYAIRENSTTPIAALRPRLTISLGGDGRGVVTGDAGLVCGAECSREYASGTTIALLAAPSAGSRFAGWTGAADCADGRVTLTRGLVCTATFLADAGGAPPPTYQRYLAEGATGTFFDTRIALLNPEADPTSAVLRFLRADGVVFEHQVEMPGRSRRTVWPGTIAGLETADFSTVVDSGLPLIVDRTMTWPRARYGSHVETSLSGPAAEWFLAEGATSDPFDVFYLLQNPGSSPATVAVTYLRTAPQPPLEKTYVVAPSSRLTIWVDREELPAGSGQQPLAQGDVSARLVSSAPIVVERAMYYSAPGRPFGAGHSSAGAPAAATRWFFAEGATGSFFDLFILLANPGDRDAAVEARYTTSAGTRLVKPYAVPARSRVTIWVDEETFGDAGRALANAEVSTTVISTNDVPIVAERTMWWPQGAWYEAHNSLGALAAATRWALAEGEAGGDDGLQTYVLIANTSDVPGDVRVTVLFEDGTQAERTFGVAAHSRFSVDVAAEFPAAAGRRFGALVESFGTAPAAIVVERAMYSNLPGSDFWGAGTNALGTPLDVLTAHNP